MCLAAAPQAPAAKGSGRGHDLSFHGKAFRVRKHKPELICEICEPECGVHMGAGVPFTTLPFLI